MYVSIYVYIVCCIYVCIYIYMYGHITLQPKTGCPLNLSRVEPGQYLDERPPGKTRLLLEEVTVRPAQYTNWSLTVTSS